MVRVVSTVHKAGWDIYGSRWIEATKHWPDAEFWLYTEGFDLDDPRVRSQRIESLPRAEAFKDAYKHYKPMAWRWDIVKWSNKVFAAYDALRDYSGLGIWLDADCITTEDIPPGYVEAMLKRGCYWAGFRRTGRATETGFWLMDCNHPEHGRFMDRWVEWLESGAFQSLDQWCDASTMDATLRAFQKNGLIDTISLSGRFESSDLPLQHVPLSQYITHFKGDRKQGLHDAEPV